MSQNSPTLPGPVVTVDWLAQNLHRDDVVVFDSSTSIISEAGVERIVPGIAAYEEAHIPGARFIDLQRDLSDPDGSYPFTVPSKEAFAEGLQKLGVKQHDTLVVYSTASPWWATRIWWLFQLHGLKNIAVLDGGLKEWRRRGHPVETGPAPVPPPGDIAVATRLDRVIDADTLRERLGAPDLLLVNALSPDRFSGETPVHGGRPGHIPGSLNLPAASLIDPQTNLFLDRERIIGLLRDKGLLTHEGDIVAYCGGGISATLVLFALALAGREDTTLYDASLYEWGHREDLPIETGPGTR